MSSGQGQQRTSLGPARPDRGHEIGEHTADARIHAWAATLPELFEEVALGLARLSAEVEAGSRISWSEVELHARDLDGLAFVWLNELIGVAELERRAVASIDVAGTERLAGGEPEGWRLRARVGLVDYGPGGSHALRHVKAATMHGLHVREEAGGWTVEAVVDI